MEAIITYILIPRMPSTVLLSAAHNRGPKYRGGKAFQNTNIKIT
jgi:hypothetical protein